MTGGPEGSPMEPAPRGDEEPAPEPLQAFAPGEEPLRGDSWDVEPAAVQPLPAQQPRPVLRPVAAEVADIEIDEPETEGGTGVRAAAPARQSSMSDTFQGAPGGPPREGANGEQTEGEGGRRRRRRRRRGRGGRPDGAPEGDAPAPPAAQASAPPPARPLQPRPQPAPAANQPRPPQAAPPPVRTPPPRPGSDRPVRLGGGYQKREPGDAGGLSTPVPAALAPAATPATAPAPAAPAPEPKPGALAAAKRFLYSTRRKLSPGEVKKLPRE